MARPQEMTGIVRSVSNKATSCLNASALTLYASAVLWSI